MTLRIERVPALFCEKFGTKKPLIGSMSGLVEWASIPMLVYSMSLYMRLERCVDDKAVIKQSSRPFKSKSFIKRGKLSSTLIPLSNTLAIVE